MMTAMLGRHGCVFGGWLTRGRFDAASSFGSFGGLNGRLMSACPCIKIRSLGCKLERLFLNLSCVLLDK
jgi:hypothetical protein